MDLSDFLPKSHKKGNKKENSEKEIKTTEDDLSQFFPTSFGKKEEKKEVTFEENKRSGDNEIKVIKLDKEKNENGNLKDDIVDSDDSESSLEDEDDLLKDINELPISHEAKVMGHEKAVSALSLDRSGTRLISGSYDSNIKLYDFSGMDANQRSFKTFEPVEGHHVHDIKHNLSGENFLCITSGLQAMLFSREGEKVGAFAKGDPYIRDLRKTAGHVANITQAEWHPFNKDLFCTSARDGTIRIWNVNTRQKSKETIVVNNRRLAITATTFSFDGKLVAGAGLDGSISIWNGNGPYIRATQNVANAHQPNTDTSSLCFSKNCYHLVSRGGDSTVKLWDLRNFKAPLKVASNLASYNSEANVCFSPDEKFILAGTGVDSDDEYGKLVFLDKLNLEVVKSANITKSSVIKILWHPGINQIVTGSADGSIHVLFDPNRSIRGAKLFLSRQPRKRDVGDMEMMGPIMTLYDEEPDHPSFIRNRLRKDPIASRRPDLPSTAPGKTGKVGTNYTNHIMRQLIKDTTRDEDPREALLKYAKVAEEDPQFVGHAYKKTQPKPIFDERKDEEEEKRDVKRKK